MVEAAAERYGGLHVLVNNLGYRIQPGVRGRDVAGFNEEQYELAMDLNLKTALLASKHAIPAMAKSGGGSIINIASIDGLAAARHRGVLYSISNRGAADADQGKPVFFEPLGRQGGGSFHSLMQQRVGAKGYRKEAASRGMEAQSSVGDGSRKTLA